MEQLDINRFFSMQPKMRQLLLLIALDKYRNIHRAAEALHTTQPAASKQLKDLEDLLGVRLFERLPRGMEPTIYGTTMIHYASMVLNNLSSAKDDILALKTGLAGQVTIGTIPTTAVSLLPQVIARLKKEAPSLRITVEVAASNVLLEKLQNGLLDLAICHTQRNHDSDNLVAHPLNQEPNNVAVARVGHPVLKCENSKLKDLVTYPWILPPQGNSMRNNIEMMLQLGGVEQPGYILEAVDLLMIVPLLQQTDFLHFMPVAVANHYTAMNAMAIVNAEFAWPVFKNSLSIIKRNDRPPSPGADLLSNTVREAALVKVSHSAEAMCAS